MPSRAIAPPARDRSFALLDPWPAALAVSGLCPAEFGLFTHLRRTCKYGTMFRNFVAVERGDRGEHRHAAGVDTVRKDIVTLLLAVQN
jgi:hypothetical protein